MAKKNSLIKAIECMAKTGITEFKLSVYPSDMELLRIDGFEVILPSRYREIPKARQEVTICWKNAVRGVAKRMKALVEDHEHKNASASRDYLTSEGKVAKEVMKDYTAKKHSESLSSFEDEEFYEEVAKRYSEDFEPEIDEDFTGIDPVAFYAAEDAAEDARYVADGSCELA